MKQKWKIANTKTQFYEKVIWSECTYFIKTMNSINGSAYPENTRQTGKYQCTADHLFVFDLLFLNEQQFYLFGQIQTGQTGGQPYSDSYPYRKVSIPC